MSYFIQKEFDNEPVYIVDEYTDEEVVTISGKWGTPQDRAELARFIRDHLIERTMAR